MVSGVLWGIVGTGSIAKSFAQDLNQHPSGASRLWAVLSRTQQRALEFGRQLGVPDDRCFYDFDAFLASGLTACYISTPHTTHADHAVTCLNGGAAVLVEKPLSLTKLGAERVFQVAKEKGLFAMEAVWTRFIPGMEAVQEKIVNGELGNLMSIDTDFGFDGADAPSRLTDPELGGGSLFDLATYSLHLPSFLCKELEQVAPTIVHTNCQMSGMVDKEFKTLLVYEGKEGEIHMSFRTKIDKDTSCTAVIRGDKGVCVIESPFHCPDRFWMNGNVFFVGKFGHGLHYQVREVEKCIGNGELQSSRMPWADSIQVADTLERLGKMRPT